MTKHTNCTYALYIILSCLLAISLSQTSEREICYVVDPSIDKTPIKLTPDSPPLQIEQDSCLQYFQTERPEGDYNYLLFEVQLESFPASNSFLPLLVQQASYLPELYFNANNFVQNHTDDIDLNSSLNRKLYHYIIVDLQYISPETILYFGMYHYFNRPEDYEKATFSYTVTAKFSVNFPCPQDCSGNGICDQELRQCLCQPGFFDRDCSIPATFLSFGGETSQVVEAYSWKYFYLDSFDYGGSLKLTTEKSPGPLSLSFLFNKRVRDYNLPNLKNYDGRYNLAPDVNEQALNILQSDLKGHQGDILMIGAYNGESSPMAVGFQVELSEGDDRIRNIIMFSMIAIASLILLVWTIFTILKYKTYREAQAMQRAHMLLLNQKDHLTKEEVEKYFPKKTFSQLKSSFPQTMCSICLEDFQGETVCRQLFCEHLYHENCIESWLTSKDSCPNCKKEMSRTAIEEYLNNLIKPVVPEKKDNATIEQGKPLNQPCNTTTRLIDTNPESDAIDSRQNPRDEPNNHYEMIRLDQEDKAKSSVGDLELAQIKGSETTVVESEGLKDVNIPIQMDPVSLRVRNNMRA